MEDFEKGMTGYCVAIHLEHNYDTVPLRYFNLGVGEWQVSENAMQGKAIPKPTVTLNPNAVIETELPLGGDSLNFAVMRKDGTSSNAWGVKVNKNNGGAFVYCRDNMNEVKASLHQSGDYRYGIRHEKYDGLVKSGVLEPGADRTWIRWV